jgi:hypothetical protein
MMAYHASIRRALQTWAVKPGARLVPILNARYGSQSALAGAAAQWLVPPHQRND